MNIKTTNQKVNININAQTPIEMIDIKTETPIDKSNPNQFLKFKNG